MAFPIENIFSANLTNMLITFVIPFLIFFAVLLFALKRTRIFGDGSFIYILLSLGITVMIYAVNPGNVFQFLASYLLQIGISASMIALGGVVLIIFIALIRRGAKIAEKLKGDEQKLKDLTKEEEKLLKKFHSTGILGIGGTDVGKRIEIQKKLEELDKERKFLLSKMRRQSA